MTTKTRVELFLLLVLAVVLGFYVYQRVGIRMGGSPSSLRGAYDSEEAWIVGEIARDIAELAARSRGVAPASASVELVLTSRDDSHFPDGGVEVAIADQSVNVTLRLERSFWNPDNYVPLARELLDVGAVTEGDASVLEALFDLRAVVLVEQNRSVSERLERNLWDAGAHEDAALLLGGFVLREAARRFDDTRQLLGRMTMHLAVARALRGNERHGPSGRVADATLMLLSGRHEEALDAIERLTLLESSAARAWRNALLMYATLDWRPGHDPTESLLERIMRFRAMVSSLGAPAAVARTGDVVYGELVDWGRLVVWKYEGGASARFFMTTQLERELSELREVWTGIHGQPLPRHRLVRELNAAAPRLVVGERIEVLSWGTWAASYQRHVGGLVDAAEEHLRQSLAVAEWADAFGEETDSLLKGATLDPIVQVRKTRRVGARVEDTVGMDASIALAQKRPELVNAMNWAFLADTASHMMRKNGMPAAESWFSTPVLLTSTIDTRSRMSLLERSISKEEVADAVAAIAPRDPSSQDFALSRRKGGDRSMEGLTRELGERLGYDLYALRWLRGAARNDRERVPVLERMCELDANDCIDLGWAYVRMANAPEAARAFQQSLDEAPDRVTVCNNANWLVNHYFDEGRRAEAMAVAESVAEVYCSWGLQTYAHLLERFGRTRHAEEVYLANAKRYDEDDSVSFPLVGFYYRMARVSGEASYEDELREQLGKIFPHGLEPLPGPHDTALPAGGVLIDGDSDRLASAGLRGSDVIVGYDGYRVRSLEQYDAIRNFVNRTSGARGMRLRVWRQTQYLDIEAANLGRRFDVRMRTHGTPGPSVESR